MVSTTCVLVGVLVAWLFVLARSTIRPPCRGVVCSGAALLATSAWLLASIGLFVSMAVPVAVLAVLFVVFLLMRYALEKRRAHDRLEQLENARKVTMESMAAVAETRDSGNRRAHQAHPALRSCGRAGAAAQRYCRQMLTSSYIELLFLSAPLHDIGKVGVPDHILLKPGRLTPQEMTQMKLHAEFGRKIVFSTAQGIHG